MSSTEPRDTLAGTRDAVRSMDPSTIVVAVDGSGGSDRAIAWATSQAYLERRSLTVVTALGAPQAHPDQRVLGADVTVEEAVAVARHLHPALEVTGMVLAGDPRQVLLDLSRRVHMIVIGSRGRGPVRSKLLGSLSAAVSHGAACPVVVCRPPNGPVEPNRGVLLGADGTVESLAVVEFAFCQASLMDLPLTVVHCLWDATRPTHEPQVVPAEDEGGAEYRLLLAETVAGMSSKFPEVVVELRLERGLAEECLSHDTEDWSLIVLGRHPVDTPLRLATGVVAKTVVERARTTVAVVPESHPADC